jgi:Uma2 family endonuclease
MIAQKNYSYSITEYLHAEVVSEARHEYINGQILPMAGGTPNHNRIALNVGSILNFALKDQSYDVFVSDQRLWIDQMQIYIYPDVMIVRGMLEYQILQDHKIRRDSITNPILIVEVLSKSTRSYDQGDKFTFYRTIPSFQEYLVIDQSNYQIDHYVKVGDKKWTLEEHNSLEDQVNFACVQVSISLKDIYNKVEINPSLQA